MKCRRPGCNKPFLESDNDGTKCRFHSGKPIFHDQRKGWECCKQTCYDWTEFEALVGCCIGQHTSDPEAAKTEFWRSSTVEHASEAVRKQEIAAMRTAEDFNREQDEAKAAAAAAAAAIPQAPMTTKDGSKFYCGNAGCATKTFIEAENGPEACNYHSGEAVFHDLKKYWTCCNKDRPCHDWDDFMKLPTCTVGAHIFKYKKK